eukprot:TRINITY_DN1747_c0_g2_i1.p1 TRINITY_DN1747_c0_g2~~TRINITY_DN1747_c0_g2_i1.p1  ORF type:complete len:432 (+),score=91.90 TRINITY_DN1747_c0_g2_i1:179-1474(+)
MAWKVRLFLKNENRANCQLSIQNSNDYNQVQLLTEALMKHAINITHHPRRFMETNPNAAQPKDFTLYPGKMDHITCVSVRVGSLPSHPYTCLQSVLDDPVARGFFEEFLKKCRRNLEKKETIDSVMADPVVDLQFYYAVEEISNTKADELQIERLLDICNHFFGSKDDMVQGFDSSSEFLLPPLSPTRSPLSSYSSSTVPLVVLTTAEPPAIDSLGTSPMDKTPEKYVAPIASAEKSFLSSSGCLSASLVCVVCATTPCSCTRLCISSATKKDIAVSLRASLIMVQREVANRLEGRYFRDFADSWWMKEGWIQYKNKKRRPFYPVPSLPFVEKKLERSSSSFSVSTEKLRSKSKSSKGKERKKKKKERKERHHRRDAKSEKEVATVAIEKLTIVDTSAAEQDKETIVDTLLVNITENNSSGDVTSNYENSQ